MAQPTKPPKKKEVLEKKKKVCYRLRPRLFMQIAGPCSQNSGQQHGDVCFLLICSFKSNVILSTKYFHKRLCCDKVICEKKKASRKFYFFFCRLVTIFVFRSFQKHFRTERTTKNHCQKVECVGSSERSTKMLRNACK